jgi:predicted nucleic acid-binding protein
MTTSIDTNVIAALWNRQDPTSLDAVRMLSLARKQGSLVVVGPVYSELMAGPLRDEAALDAFFNETEIAVDWRIGEDVWREAGKVFRGYAARRVRSGGGFPRRILTDFLIGAHAMLNHYALLTIDRSLYAAAFPKLKIISS